MKLILSIICFALAACIHYEDGFGGKVISVGGSSASEFPSGGRVTQSHTKSLQHVVQGVVSLASMGVSALLEHGKQITQRLASADLSRTERLRLTGELELAKAELAERGVIFREFGPLAPEKIGPLNPTAP